MQILNKVLGLSAGLVLALGAATSAQAASLCTTDFYFSGACTDCTAPGGTGPVTGRLTLSNYAVGDSIFYTEGDGIVTNFVAFTYGGSSIIPEFTVNIGGAGGNIAVTNVAGIMTNLPGFNDFLLQFDNGHFFQTTPDGRFSVCTTGPCSILLPLTNDIGDTAIWNNRAPALLPEPGSLALVGLAITALAIARRRRSL